MMTAERLAEIRAGANNPTWSAGARLVATELLAHIDHLAAEVERLLGAGEGQCPPNVCAVCYHRKDACAHCDKPTVTDAMVEAAAKGLAESDDEAWRYHSEATRQWYLRHARRALTAALGEAARV